MEGLGNLRHFVKVGTNTMNVLGDQSQRQCDGRSRPHLHLVRVIAVPVVNDVLHVHHEVVCHSSELFFFVVGHSDNSLSSLVVTITYNDNITRHVDVTRRDSRNSLDWNH